MNVCDNKDKKGNQEMHFLSNLSEEWLLHSNRFCNDLVDLTDQIK